MSTQLGAPNKWNYRGQIADITAKQLLRILERFPNIGLSPMFLFEDGRGIKVLFNLRSASSTMLFLLGELSLFLDASFFIHGLLCWNAPSPNSSGLISK